MTSLGSRLTCLCKLLRGGQWTYSDGGLVGVAEVIHPLLEAQSGFSQNHTLQERAENNAV